MKNEKKIEKNTCPLYKDVQKEYGCDYDMIMVYCPKCHRKFVNYLRPYLWEENSDSISIDKIPDTNGSE